MNEHGAAGEPAREDAALFETLAHLLRGIDPVPETVVRAAEDAGAWVPASGEPTPARLVELHETLLTGALRGGEEAGDGDHRVFRCAGTTVRIEPAEATGPGWSLSGVVLPCGATTRVELHTPSGQHRCGLDGAGRFAVAVPARGPARLLVFGESREPMSTGWFLL